MTPPAISVDGWLLKQLATGSVSSTELYDRAWRVGLSYRTLTFARDRLGGRVRTRRTRDGWVWEMTPPELLVSSQSTPAGQ